MKINTQLRPLAAGLQLAALAIFIGQSYAGNTWDGSGGDNNWTTNANWNLDTAPGYGTLIFTGNTRVSNVLNANYSMNQVNWNGTSAWTLSNSGGSTLSLFDNGGTQAKLESLGTGGVTISANITFAANNGAPPNPFGEINAVSSNIAFTGGTLTVNGSSVNGIKLFGGAGRDVSFANTVNASGKWIGFTNANGSSATIATGANVTMGDFYVMNGNTLNLAGGTLTTSAVRLGGDFGNTGNQNQVLGGTLALTPLTGGVSFSSIINTVSGNTSNALLIDSKNTSGTNTLTGSLFLDSDLRTLQQAGGTLAFTTGSTDIKGRKLTVDGAGTTSVSQVLSSSLAAGGSLVKSGAGTLILSNTANTYTGTSSATLNANGTQIAAGTLAIAADASLGLAPAGAYNNVQFTGTGSLRSDSSISLNANRNVSIASAATGTLDNNGNTFTVNGVINGTGGNLASAGSGTTVLTGNNTYTGTTTVTAGTLQVGSGSTSGTLGAGAVTNNANLAFNRSDTATVSNAISGSGNVIQSGSGTTILTGANSYGTTTVSTGTLQVGNGGTTGTLGSGAVTNNATLAFNRSDSVTVSNDISGSGTVTKSAGGTVILTGTNSYGATTISAGTLQVGNGGATGSLGTGAVTNNGALVFNRASGAPNNFILTNAISGSGTLTQRGANIITISSANSYTGATTINSGTLRVTANDALGTTAAGTTVNSGGSLLLSSVNYSTAEALSINGTGVGGTGALRNNLGSSTYAGQVTVSSNATINVTGIGESLTLTGGVVKNGTTLTIKGSGSVIVNGTGISGASANSDLVIDGGTLVTSVASTYNGPTTVQNTGTLIANNASGSATGTGSVTISSNSTLSGTGAINAGAGNFITINGTLQVGDSTLGSPVASSFTLTTSGGGSTVLGSSSTLKFDLFSRGGDLSGNSSAADYIRLFGPLDGTAGGTLMIASNGLSGFASGDRWKLFEVTGPGTISGMLNLDYSSLGLGPALSASFDNNTGIFSVVPEPSRVVLLFMGTFGVLLRRRRR